MSDSESSTPESSTRKNISLTGIIGIVIGILIFIIIIGFLIYKYRSPKMNQNVLELVQKSNFANLKKKFPQFENI